MRTIAVEFLLSRSWDWVRPISGAQEHLWSDAIPDTTNDPDRNPRPIDHEPQALSTEPHIPYMLYSAVIMRNWSLPTRMRTTFLILVVIASLVESREPDHHKKQKQSTGPTSRPKHTPLKQPPSQDERVSKLMIPDVPSKRSRVSPVSMHGFISWDYEFIDYKIYRTSFILNIKSWFWILLSATF